jgi:amidase
VTAAYNAAFAEADVLVMPTNPMKPMPIPVDPDLPTYLRMAWGTSQNTSPFNVTGHPAVTVPCGLVSGLPIGMMIVGRHFDDSTVLRVAHAYEQKRN